MGLVADPDDVDDIAREFQNMVGYAKDHAGEVKERSKILMQTRFNKEEIDEMFAQCEVMKVLDTYQKGETESLQEKYSENVIYAINEKKTELLKQIKSFENRKYCRYFYKVEAVDKLLKPTLEYLLKKKDDLEKSLNIMKREIKKQKNLQ